MASKTCPICTSAVNGLLKSPSTCCDPNTGNPILHTEHDTNSHGEQICNKACADCWEMHISHELHLRPTSLIRCMFCLHSLSESELQRLSRDATHIHYNQKRAIEGTFRCQNRCQGANTPFQPYDRERDGRLFTCNLCSSETCTDCDRPEHFSQSCEDFQTLQSFDHINRFADAVTQNIKAAHDFSGTKYSTHRKHSQYISCPNCGVLGERNKKDCGYTQCYEKMRNGRVYGRGYRFCTKCLIPWAGPGGSYYSGGNLAHKEGCRYRNRALASAYCIKSRFELDEVGQAKLDEKKARKIERARDRAAQKEGKATQEQMADRKQIQTVVQKRKLSEPPEESNIGTKRMKYKVGDVVVKNGGDDNAAVTREEDGGDESAVVAHGVKVDVDDAKAVRQKVKIEKV